MRVCLDDHDVTAILAAAALLEDGTSNSLDPVHRQGWNDDRDLVVRDLRDVVARREVP